MEEHLRTLQSSTAFQSSDTIKDNTGIDYHLVKRVLDDIKQPSNDFIS